MARAIELEKQEENSSSPDAFVEQWEEWLADFCLNSEIEEANPSRRIAKEASSAELAEYLQVHARLRAAMERKDMRSRARDLMRVAEWNRLHPEDPYTCDDLARLAPDLLPGSSSPSAGS